MSTKRYPNQKAQQDAWRARNPDRVAAYNERMRAVRKGVTGEIPAPGSHCECCGELFTSPGRAKGERYPVLDHCHILGIFRGWICNRCNVAIGLLGDLPSRLRAAADYLERAYRDN